MEYRRGKENVKNKSRKSFKKAIEKEASRTPTNPLILVVSSRPQLTITEKVPPDPADSKNLVLVSPTSGTTWSSSTHPDQAEGVLLGVDLELSGWTKEIAVT